MKIRLVQHNDIDFQKWDECIQNSINGIIYAYSWYLNIVADEWDALVGDDYNAVFPIVHGQKYRFNYLYQPFFSQQLGIFSKSKIDNQLVVDFIEMIPAKYEFQIINFNTYIKIENRYNTKDRVTYQLDLIQPYHLISSRYNDNTKRNISKSIAHDVFVVKGLGVDEFVKFKVTNLSTPLKEYHISMIKQIVSQSLMRGNGEIFAAYSKQNELCASALFLKSNGKVIYLFASSNPTGKDNRAMFTLVDHFINVNSESHLVLDFEGSMIETIARFYSGFGAIPCTYQQLVVNKLPWYVRMFMR